MNNYLFEMIMKIIFTNYLSELIHQVAVKFSSERPCRRSVLNPTLYLDTIYQNAAGKILKTPYEFYEYLYPCLRSFAVKTLLRVLKSSTWLDTRANRISWEI